MSQGKFAKLVGLSRKQIGNYENKGEVPRLGQLIIIAEKLGMSIDLLLFNKVEPHLTIDGSTEIQDLRDRIIELKKSNNTLQSFNNSLQLKNEQLETDLSKYIKEGSPFKNSG